MSIKQSLSVTRIFLFAAALLLSIGGLSSASGQIPNQKFAGDSGPTAPNPKPYLNRVSGRRSAIGLAIEAGNAARDRGDYEQALVFYKKAQELNRQDARGFYGMGNIYSDLFCDDSAIEAYLKAIELKRDYLEAMVALGNSYSYQERYDQAKEQFQAALRLAPNSVDANIGLGLVYSRMKKYSDAIAQIKHIINTQSTSVEDRAAAYIALGDVYDDQEKWQEAIAQCEEARKLKPTLARAYLKLGIAQLEKPFLLVYLSRWECKTGKNNSH
ncbi:MAG TPA: tetratricopeptide repeat protein [Pyrinomonadaceae bacterium]|nr:tetratricopeptide repeat protein [Pyrinomonadaceae bacterium]